MTVAFALVPAVWWVIVTIVAGRFESEEVARFRQFVWMADALRGGLGTFATALRGQLSLFARACAAVAWFPVASCAAAGLVAVMVGVRGLRVQWRTLAAAGIALAVTLLFFGLMGWYNLRLASNVVPPLLAVTAVLLSSAMQRVGRFGGVLLSLTVGATVLGWTVHELRRDYLFALPAPPPSIRHVR